MTTGGPYTYSQSGHHFSGTGYDGTNINTYGACSGNGVPKSVFACYYSNL
jgi:hypothetical protein